MFLSFWKKNERFEIHLIKSNFNARRKEKITMLEGNHTCKMIVGHTGTYL